MSKNKKAKKTTESKTYIVLINSLIYRLINVIDIEREFEIPAFVFKEKDLLLSNKIKIFSSNDVKSIQLTVNSKLFPNISKSKVCTAVETYTGDYDTELVSITVPLSIFAKICEQHLSIKNNPTAIMDSSKSKNANGNSTYVPDLPEFVCTADIDGANGKDVIDFMINGMAYNKKGKELFKIVM